MASDTPAANPAALAHKELWTLRDLTAAGLGSRTTIWRAAKADPTFPEPVRVGSYPKWRPADIRAWLAGKAASKST